MCHVSGIRSINILVIGVWALARYVPEWMQLHTCSQHYILDLGYMV